MKVLTLNSAFLESNIAFKNDDEEKFLDLNSSLKHSENMLKGIEEVLGENKVKDLDYLGVVIGPGSFTGIRIGVSIVKAFMTTCENIKAVAINSLEFLAFSYLKDYEANGDFYAVLNALSGNYYIAKYSKEGKCLIEPYLADITELSNIYEKTDTVVGLLGEDVGAEYTINLDSETLLELTLRKINEKDFVSENNLLPLYLRLSQAEQALKDKK